MKRVIEWLIYAYLLTLMFGGIFTKVMISSSILMSIKGVLPDIIMILLIIVSIIEIIIKWNSNKKSLKFLGILSAYIIFIFILNLINCPSVDKVLFILRDTCLPFISLFLLMKINFSELEIERIKKVIISILSIQIILGFILGIIQYNNGWEWTSKFYTGYSFYGIDPISNIKIWQSSGNLRIPSLAGNSVLFAFYNYIAYIIIKSSKIKFKKTLIILSIVNIYLSTTKTVLLLVVFDFILICIINSKTKLKVLLIDIGLLLIGAIIILLPLANNNIYFSIGERIIHWGNIFNSFNILDYIIPLNLFNLGAGTEGALGFVDNAYFYFLLSYGVVGIVLYVIFIGNQIRVSIKSNMKIIVGLLIGLLISSITTNIFQGRTYISVICIIYFIYYEKRAIKIEKK